MNAEIIAVGTEILLGDIVNTNTQYLSRELASIGIDVYYQSVVGDNQKRLEQIISNAFSRADLVITTGGLGPTEDDLTKETGAKYFNRQLILDEQVLTGIEKYFDSMGRCMTENNQKQAYIPEGARIIPNDFGTAPGIILEDGEKKLILLPGPPRETIPMFAHYVKPYLSEKQEFVFLSRTLRVAGIGESSLEMKIKDLIDAQTNPTIAPYAKTTEAILRITAKAKTAEEAKERIEPIANKIYERLGNRIYAEGDTSLSAVVAEMLIERNMTISVSESLTGGLLTSAFIEYPGISKIFCSGHVCYSNKAKKQFLNVKGTTLRQYGAVSHKTAYEMVSGLTEATGTDIGLSTTGIAGPDGGTEEKPVGLVYIGLSIDGEIKTRKFHFNGDRQTIRERTVFAALNWLRLELLKKDNENEL